MPVTICPRCRKTLSDAPAVAQFCMYCGSKLSTSLDYSPNDQTADIVTRSHIPAIESIADDGDDDQSGDLPPRVVGGYSLVRILGAGGQGSVYEAEQSDSGQRVALKLLSSKFKGSAVSIERFRQEGRLASQITHPRCVFVYGADTDSGVPFIVMELMPGTTLKDLVDRQGALPVGEAIARILDVIDGLIEAHRLGVIHRDVKPSNCFITHDDRVKIGDFGLSKSLGGSNPGRQLTTSGKFVGTVLFAPPEQIRGEEVGYDSDVYSVAATLYFLLTAKAPHQHESLTAALAKAISEAPPSIRSMRPDVPKELDRACLKGLERDRGRRWQSLEEFRDSLLEMLPSRHTPARPRSIIVAYIIDLIITALLIDLPLKIIHDLMFASSESHFSMWSFFDFPGWIATILYFGFFEGILGWTPGKWLLRLRVVRQGETGPPGLALAFKRAVAFHVIWVCMLALPLTLFPEILLEAVDSSHHPHSWLRTLSVAQKFLAIIFSIGLVISGVVILLNQCRRKWGFRGVHDMASGCRIVQRPHKILRRRLVSRFPSPLERTTKPAADLPESVGGFSIRGQIGSTSSKGLVWLAEDQSLARRILIWLRPTDENVMSPLSVVRPTRLRQVGDGCLDWNGKTYEWTGFVAPAGAPLADVANPKDPISWADARPLLEQLIDELITSDADKSLPSELGTDQIWVEPAGRLHLVDFPLPTGNAPPATPGSKLNLVRQTASLALQGVAWEKGEMIRSPLPPHAALIVDKLTSRETPYRDLTLLQKDLSESHSQASRVTSGVRATHVGLQGIFLSIFHMFSLLVVTVVMFSWIQSLPVALWAAESAKMYEGSQDPATMAKVLANKKTRVAMSPENREATLRTMMRRNDAHQTNLHQQNREMLTGPERMLQRWLTEGVISQFPNTENEIADELVLCHTLNASAQKAHAQNPAMPSEPEINISDETNFIRVVGIGKFITLCFFFFLVNRFVCAVLFRGGLSWVLTGITLVHNDGRPIGRFWCGVRAVIVWLPVVVLSLVLLVLQINYPQGVFLRIFLTFSLLIVLIGYVVVAIRYPCRPPQDRLMGTHIVPM